MTTLNNEETKELRQMAAAIFASGAKVGPEGEHIPLTPKEATHFALQIFDSVNAAVKRRNTAQHVAVVMPPASDGDEGNEEE